MLRSTSISNASETRKRSSAANNNKAASSSSGSSEQQQQASSSSPSSNNSKNNNKLTNSHPIARHSVPCFLFLPLLLAATNSVFSLSHKTGFSAGDRVSRTTTSSAPLSSGDGGRRRTASRFAVLLSEVSPPPSFTAAGGEGPRTRCVGAVGPTLPGARCRVGHDAATSPDSGTFKPLPGGVDCCDSHHTGRKALSNSR